MVRDFGSGLTQTFTFYCGKPEVDLVEILVGTGRPSEFYAGCWSAKTDRRTIRANRAKGKGDDFLYNFRW